MKTQVGIIGIGMVGTPLMRWFADNGWKRKKDLFCYDADPKKNYFDDVSAAEVLFVCVPTPPNPDGSCNVSIVESVVEKLPAGKRTIVIKSTVPPGTTAGLRKKYKSRGHFIFNPEFLTEAQAWEDFIRPDRQIMAHADEESRSGASAVMSLLPLASFSSPGVEGTYQFHEAHSTEAELAKYGGNVFGAVKVAFANILADFCLMLEADYENVRRLISHDRRIGGSWLDVNKGKYRGFGGYCFPKDLDALIAHGELLVAKVKKNDIQNKEVFIRGLNVLKSVRDYNEALLQSQGLTTKEVSRHDAELRKKLEQKQKGGKK